MDFNIYGNVINAKQGLLLQMKYILFFKHILNEFEYLRWVDGE